VAESTRPASVLEASTNDLRELDAYELEFYAEDDGAKPVLAWIKNDLTPAQRRAVGTAMRRVLQANGVGVCSSPSEPSRSRQQREIETARARLQIHRARAKARK